MSATARSSTRWFVFVLSSLVLAGCAWFYTKAIRPNPSHQRLPQMLLAVTSTGKAAVTHDSKTWDSYGLGGASNAIFIKGQYWVCFGGYSSSAFSSAQAIGCASGNTPASYTMYPGNPVLSNTSPPPWSTTCMEGPTLFSDGTNVYMYYNGYTGTCDGAGTGSVGMVRTTTADFPTGWSAAPSSPTITRGSSLHWIYRASVQASGGTYYAFLNAGDRWNRYVVACYTAPSPGGPWTYQSKSLTATQPWEKYEIQEPQVWQDPSGEWIMSYGVSDGTAATTKVGLASNSTLSCSGWTKYPNNPISVSGISDLGLPRFVRDAEGTYWMLSGLNRTSSIHVGKTRAEFASGLPR